MEGLPHGEQIGFQLNEVQISFSGQCLKQTGTHDDPETQFVENIESSAEYLLCGLGNMRNRKPNVKCITSDTDFWRCRAMTEVRANSPKPT